MTKSRLTPTKPKWMLSVKKLWQIPFCFLLSFSFIGCSSALSRSDAAEQLRQALQLPHGEFQTFRFREQKAVVAYVDPKPGMDGSRYYLDNKTFPKSGLLSSLEREGLISIAEERVEVNRRLDYGTRKRYDYEEYYVATLTDKGRAFGEGERIKVATIDFGSITGIVERPESHTAKVQYTLTRNNITPFGRAVNMTEETFTQTATFTKFDDGWRIDR